MDPSSDSASFREQSLSALKGLTRATNQLASQDLAFHKSLDSSVGPAVDEQGNKILYLANDLLRCVSGTDKRVPHLTDEESVDDNWRSIVDVIDGLLEKADACLDEFTGLIKKTPQNARDQKSAATDSKAKFPSSCSRTSRIPKPQIEFEHAPDNANTSAPWRPLLTSKPHSSVPYSKSLQLRDGSYPNPYEVEIKQAKYPSATYAVAEPQGYLPFESTTATFVDTFEGVKKMLAQLKQAKELAIDLEHHDTHSYQGIVCLMQISTRDADWIVDTLKPWRQDLQILNEVFADPNILKVFHGAFMDMIWLQRDLGIYVVNLFDTFHAANALGYPKKSLKYLLDKFVNFQAEKQYQMADWRLRPLLPGMFDYARSDTHYLLYIYDLMRNELVENSDPETNLVDYVSERSKEESLQRFERPTYDVETGKGSVGWYELLLKTSVLFSKEQFAVFRAVHRWRDEVARAEDEGLQYVLAKHALFRIAHAMPLDPIALLKAAAPVSPVVRAHILELVELIKKAKIDGANGPELRDVLHPITGEPPQAISRAATPTEKTRFGTAVVERADLSQFWGAALRVPEPSLINFNSIDSAIEAFFMSVPMPAKSLDPDDNAFAAVQTQAQAPVSASVAQPATSDKTPKKPSNDIFTAKSFSSSSRKRKHEDTEDAAQQSSTAMEQQDQQSVQAATAPPGDDLSLEGAPTKVVSPSPHTSKNQRKRRRQAENRLARQQLELQEKEKRGDTGAASAAPAQSQLSPEAEAPSAPAAFDYTQAQSVHAAPPTSSTTGPQKRQKKKNFNPYAKATHTSTGLGRIKRDTSGKSHTFK